MEETKCIRIRWDEEQRKQRLCQEISWKGEWWRGYSWRPQNGNVNTKGTMRCWVDKSHGGEHTSFQCSHGHWWIRQGEQEMHGSILWGPCGKEEFQCASHCEWHFLLYMSSRHSLSIPATLQLSLSYQLSSLSLSLSLSLSAYIISRKTKGVMDGTLLLREMNWTFVCITT